MSNDPSSSAATHIKHAANSRRELPPLDFGGMIISLGTSVMISLGATPDPVSGGSEIDLLGARNAIDMLEIIQEKTRGNLTPEEDQLLGKLLFDAHVAFVKASE